MKSSTELRATVGALEAAAASAADKLAQAETDHRAALRSSVASADSGNPFLTEAATAPSRETETAVSDARTDHARTLAALDTARQLLAEALDAETQAAKAAARAGIAAQLDAMDAIARDADAHFAAFVGAMRRIRELEAETRKDTRRTFRDVWGAMYAFGTLRAIGTFLAALAGGLDPDMRPFAAEATRSIRHAVEEATR